MFRKASFAATVWLVSLPVWMTGCGGNKRAVFEVTLVTAKPLAATPKDGFPIEVVALAGPVQETDCKYDFIPELSVLRLDMKTLTPQRIWLRNPWVEKWAAGLGAKVRKPKDVRSAAARLSNKPVGASFSDPGEKLDQNGIKEWMTAFAPRRIYIVGPANDQVIAVFTAMNPVRVQDIEALQAELKTDLCAVMAETAKGLKKGERLGIRVPGKIIVYVAGGKIVVPPPPPPPQKTPTATRVEGDNRKLVTPYRRIEIEYTGNAEADSQYQALYIKVRDARLEDREGVGAEIKAVMEKIKTDYRFDYLLGQLTVYTGDHTATYVCLNEAARKAIAEKAQKRMLDMLRVDSARGSEVFYRLSQRRESWRALLDALQYADPGRLQASAKSSP